MKRHRQPIIGLSQLAWADLKEGGAQQNLERDEDMTLGPSRARLGLCLALAGTLVGGGFGAGQALAQSIGEKTHR